MAPGERKPRSLSGPEGLEPMREVRQTYPQPPVLQTLCKPNSFSRSQRSHTRLFPTIQDLDNRRSHATPYEFPCLLLYSTRYLHPKTSPAVPHYPRCRANPSHLKEVKIFRLERSRIAKFSCTVQYSTAHDASDHSINEPSSIVNRGDIKSQACQYLYNLNYCSHFGNDGSIHDVDKCVSSSIGSDEVIPGFIMAAKKIIPCLKGSDSKFNST